MKVAVTVAPRRLEERGAAEPQPSPDEALVRVAAVDLCGADPHFCHGDHPSATYPRTQGHELAGTVMACGSPYDGPIKSGDRVAVEPSRPRGDCDPRRHGRPNCGAPLQVLGVHVPGGLAERYAVQTARLYATGDLDRELAALVEPILSAFTRSWRRGHGGGHSRRVRSGPIGQAILQAAGDRGARTLVVDRIATRLELARALGAEEVVDTSHQAPLEAIADWTQGDGAGVVFNATGVPAVIRSAVDAVASAGRIVIVGLSTQEAGISVIAFTRKELTILGSRNNAGVFSAPLSRPCAPADYTPLCIGAGAGGHRIRARTSRGRRESDDPCRG